MLLDSGDLAAISCDEYMRKYMSALPPKTFQGQTPFFNSPFCHSCVTKDSSNAHEQRENAALRYEFRQLVEFNHVAFQVEGNKNSFLTEHSIGFAHASSSTTDPELRQFQRLSRYILDAGNTIWAIAGVDVPLILRRVEQHYVVAGHCYLHRAMLDRECPWCGRVNELWSVKPEIIDIW
jgi:hypothetical protein